MIIKKPKIFLKKKSKKGRTKIKIDIVKHNKLWLSISFLMLAVGGIAIGVWRLNFGIDFKGGTVLEYKFSEEVDKGELTQVITEQGVKVARIVESEGNVDLIYMDPIGEDQRRQVEGSIEQKYPGAMRESVETIGASVGDELKRRSVLAVGLVSLGIIIYLAYSFRKIPEPYSSWQFGVSAIVAVLHDVVFVVGVFAFLGHFYGVEIDSLFITAMLTVIGFSVHDSIVVFDRVRENLITHPGEKFDSIVNRSLVETLARSINLSMTVILTLMSLLILGGPSIRWFTFALLIGMVSGTYSSIFVATQVLVVWERIRGRRINVKLKNPIKRKNKVKG